MKEKKKKVLQVIKYMHFCTTNMNTIFNFCSNLKMISQLQNNIYFVLKAAVLDFFL